MRTTIDLDEKLNTRLRELAPGRGLNRFINEAVSEKVAAMEKERIKQAMREGYLATAAEQDELARDWEVVDLEGWPE
jgi:predicted transcriptional regulator